MQTDTDLEREIRRFEWQRGQLQNDKLEAWSREYAESLPSSPRKYDLIRTANHMRSKNKDHIAYIECKLYNLREQLI